MKKLINEKTIIKKIKALSKQLTNDYYDKNPVIVCVLKGSFPFFSEILKNINFPVQIEFVKISSYNGDNSENLQLLLNINTDLTNRDVLIIEDIVDTGKTLSFLIDNIRNKNTKSIKVCSLLDKPSKRICTVNLDYICFTINDNFVVGFGLDYNEKFRELNYISILEKGIDY